MDIEQQSNQEQSTAVAIPADMVDITTAVEADAVVVQGQEAPAKKEETIFFGDRYFSSKEEALTYASQKMQERAPAKSDATVDADAEIDPADIMFEDPKAAVRLIKEQAKREMVQQYNAAEGEKKLWVDFYENNKDLGKYKDFVGAKYREKFEEIKKLPLKQAMDILASETRSMLARARDVNDKQEKLNSNGATTASPSTVQRNEVRVQQSKPKSWVDELKAEKIARRTKKVV